MPLKYFLLLILPAFLWANFSEQRIHSELPYHRPLLPERSSTHQGSEVGLYVDKGTWLAGKEHLKMFFNEHGFNYRSLTAKDILNGVLKTSQISILVMPGGESFDYLRELKSEGADQIKSFVFGGGGYLGICAGAFYATSFREGGNATGPYGIGLLEGTAYDGTALKTDPFIEGMMDFDMGIHPLVLGLASQFRIVMFGGPSFRYSIFEKNKKNLQEMAYFKKIHEPSMITFEFGSGRVFLSGPHLEIEESRTDWGPSFFDPDSEWSILKRVVGYLGKASVALVGQK